MTRYLSDDERHFRQRELNVKKKYGGVTMNDNP